MEVGDGPHRLSAFVMVLSHSRMTAIVWSLRRDQLSWLHCHNESFRRLAGVAAVNRIENVKTALLQGAGAWGVIHPACRTLPRLIARPLGRSWDSLEKLQAWTDERVNRWALRKRCPATGQSVEESWQQELERLAPLPILPEPFDVLVSRPVHRDCMVRFEDRQGTIPALTSRKNKLAS
ncbi:MAG: hypothetical protein V3T83_20275 [Acidobacteriota bacterium]